MKGKFFSSIWIYLLLVVISLPLILPFLREGYFPTHDGEWAVVRLGDMYRSLRELQFPVRFSGNLNFGYGYPLFNFAYPLPYYLGSFFVFAKFGLVNSVKLMFAVSVILSSVTMYLLAKELFKTKAAGIISAVFYIYLPYRMVDLYVRGSIGESLSFALFPFILFCILKLKGSRFKVWYLAGGAFGFAALIMTHNIMATLFAPVLLITMLVVFFQDKKTAKSLFLLLFLAVSLSAFFWLPALFEKQFILLSKIPIADRDLYYVRIEQLVIPSFGYGVPDGPGGFSYQLGIPQIMAFIAGGFLLIFTYLKKKFEFEDKLVAVYFFTTLFMLLMLFPFSSFVWENVPLLKEINYPWTLLALIGLLMSIIAGYVASKGKIPMYFAGFLALVSAVIVFTYANPKEYINKGDMHYLTNDATTTSSNELMPLWVDSNPGIRVVDKVEVVRGEGEISNLFYNATSYTFTTQMKTPGVIKMNTIYYPGWKVNVNNNASDISYNNKHGVMEINVGPGRSVVVARMTETPVRLAADLVSFAALVLILVLVITNKKTKFIN